MADVFSVYSTGTDRLQVEESKATGHVVLTIFGDGEESSITVEVGDLARALFTDSPTFAKGVGEIVQRDMLASLGADPE